MAICVIWPLGFLMGLPTVLFNRLARPRPHFPVDLCLLIFPGNYSHRFHDLQRSLECLLFFVGPVVVQTVLYTFICKRLFSSTKELHRKQIVLGEDGARRERDSDAIKARKGVVKMLIASVVVYFLSYAPSQFSGIYRMVAPSAPSSWSFHVLTMTLAYINSASNPVLYVIFSQNFRVKFRQIFCHCIRRPHSQYERASPAESFTYRSNPASTTRLTTAARNASCKL